KTAKAGGMRGEGSFRKGGLVFQRLVNEAVCARASIAQHGATDERRGSSRTGRDRRPRGRSARPDLGQLDVYWTWRRWTWRRGTLAVLADRAALRLLVAPAPIEPNSTSGQENRKAGAQDRAGRTMITRVGPIACVTAPINPVIGRNGRLVEDVSYWRPSQSHRDQYDLQKRAHIGSLY